jgi:hypothetical protein
MTTNGGDSGARRVFADCPHAVQGVGHLSTENHHL